MNKLITRYGEKVSSGDIICINGMKNMQKRWERVIAMPLSISPIKQSVLLYSLCLLNKHFYNQSFTIDFILRVYYRSYKNSSIINCGYNYFVPLVLSIDSNYFRKLSITNTGIKMLDMEKWPITAILAWTHDKDITDTAQMLTERDYIETDRHNFIENARIKEGTIFHRSRSSSKKRIPDHSMGDNNTINAWTHKISIEGKTGIVKVEREPSEHIYSVKLVMVSSNTVYYIGSISEHEVCKVGTIVTANTLLDLVMTMIYKYVERNMSVII